MTEHDIPDVGKLMGLMHNFSNKWKEIGLGLGFTTPELNLIESKPSHFVQAPVSYLRDLLSQWVQWSAKDHPTKPSLRELCKTLRSVPVGLGTLAEKVEQKMEHSTNSASKMSTAVLYISNNNYKWLSMTESYGSTVPSFRSWKALQIR